MATVAITRETFGDLVIEAAWDAGLDGRRMWGLQQVVNHTNACLVGDWGRGEGDNTLEQCPAKQTGMLRDGGFLKFAMRFDKLVREHLGNDVDHLLIAEL